LSLDPAPLEVDVQRLSATDKWRRLKDGAHWDQLVLVKDDFREPLLSDCPGLASAIEELPSRVVAACLKRLGPGGFVNEHRDLVGAAPMGVVRLHVPIVTHPDVEFCVNGRRLYLRPGSAWILDTSYRHRVANRSSVHRVHLVVDLELDRAMCRLLPRRDGWDKLHTLYFWLFCAWKGVRHSSDPRHLGRLVSAAVAQRYKRQSLLP
jgi:aspartyl/asparaginyl beta-hydroxylase (cupin superfamily)